MNLRHCPFCSGTVLCFFLVFVLHRDCQAQDPPTVCSAPDRVSVVEHSPIDTVVASISAELDVVLALETNPGDYFKVVELNLLVNRQLDYETLPTGFISIRIQCTDSGQNFSIVDLIVLVLNVNDNPPVFAQSQYVQSTYELSPVDTSVGTYTATDLDGDRLYYQIEPVNNYFKIKDATTPDILVKSVTDYDFVKSQMFILTARDTSIPSPPGEPSFTATTTITINIEDFDNRPPWFKPCEESIIGTAKICLNSGYRGTVNLTEQEVGDLPLEPNSVYAIDGDKGRQEQIIYQILEGNKAGIFHINENSGNITMLKAADVAGPLVLTIVASQLLNRDQFATTSVTFDVVKKSMHHPMFKKQEYQGYCDSSLDSLVLEASGRPLRVQAQDDDFADGVNPDVQYQVQDMDFTVTAEGLILLKRDMSLGTVSFQVRAVDTSNREFGTAMVSVEVKGIITSTPTITTGLSTTGMASVTTQLTDSTASIAMTTQEETFPTSSSENFTTGPDTAHTEAELGPKVLGEYQVEDMAALGASLAVLVVLCLVIIGLLVFRIRKGDTDWKKLSEASIFRSSFARSSGGLKDGVQYTNDAFQNDEDTGSVSSNLPNKLDLTPDTDKAKETSLQNRAALASAVLFGDLLPDGSSLDGSDKADSEKEVKPILTKERRNEEGYKSVWFKEDIDPDAKEEVVIIPDTGERDADEEDEDTAEEEDGEDVSPPTLQRLDKNGASDSDSEREDVDL